MCRFPFLFFQNKPVQPLPPPYPYRSCFTCHKWGSHKGGDYIKAYIPHNPYIDSNQKYKAVIYLHGFALCVPEFYKAHLEHLARLGYFVFFPDYQKDKYDNFDPNKPITDISQLIETVTESLKSSPEDWVKAAISSTFGAFQQVEVDGKKLIDSAVDTYLFGHSLGGLFALSWPHYVNQFASELHIPEEQKQKLLPQQVIAADPVPDSLSNLPTPIRTLLESFFRLSPFVKNKIDICKNDLGKDLNVPVAILHGKDDQFVGPCSWKTPFKCIASQKKKIYFSSSDDHGDPPLLANHNQAVTDTSFLGKLAKELGGVGTVDDLKWRYIWFALDCVIQGADANQLQFDMGKWSDGTPVKGIDDSWPKQCEKLEALAASLIPASTYN